MTKPDKIDWREKLIKFFEDGDNHYRCYECVGEIKQEKMQDFIQKTTDQATKEAVEAERKRIESLIPEKRILIDDGREVYSKFYKDIGFNEAIKIMQERIKKI